MAGMSFTSVPADEERDEDLSDAVTLEIDRNGQQGSSVDDGFDIDVDDGSYRTVDTAHTPRSWDRTE
jgi:hypothetical protein